MVPLPAALFAYSGEFVIGTPYESGDPQVVEWLKFRYAIGRVGVVVNSITMRGSENMIGVTCSDPTKAAAIASALSTAATFEVICDDMYWSTSDCNAGSAPNIFEFTVAPLDDQNCKCNVDSYTLRPKDTQGWWGGLPGATTCGGPTQTISVFVT
jgi:hypothetical protein